MAVKKEVYEDLIKELKKKQVRLIAVSKTKPLEDIQALYDLGQRDFGENYVQELVEKEAALPKDIRWHFIGHLQSNKVKYIAPFVHLIHGVDSSKLLKEINKQGAKNNRVINCLLQMHIASEETKFGLDTEELDQIFKDPGFEGYKNVQVHGLMGMASFSDNKEKVRGEFKGLKQLFDQLQEQQLARNAFDTLSMGMSGDYPDAIEEGGNMIRIGSLLFGARNA
jgi:hypothetical protein